MGALSSSTSNEIQKRKRDKACNYSLNTMLKNDHDNRVAKQKILYLSVEDSQPMVEAFLGFLTRYHHHPYMLHSLIIQQIKYIVKILQILNDYELKSGHNHDRYDNYNYNSRSKSIFHCAAVDSCRWIISTYHVNMLLTHEHGKKIGNVWNDNATQTLMVLIEKYQKHNNNENSNDNNTANINSDFDYYNHIKSYLFKEYPIDSEFCRYFMSNISKFCFKEMSIENHKEKQLFLKCLTQNGKIPLSKRDLTINGYQLSNLS